MTSFEIAVGPAIIVRETMTDVHINMKERLADLASTAEKTLGAWDGDAKERYRDCKRRWDLAADTTNNAYGSAATALDNIISGYIAGDKKAGGYWPAGSSS